MHEHPKIENLCRPNILTNSDFKSGIINQKNATSYTGLGTTLATIDMWISYGINVGLNATSVRFINRDTSYHTIRQKYDVNLLKDEKYTVYMKVISLVGTVYINPKTDKTKLQKVVNGENIYTFVAGEPSGVNVQNNEFIIGLEAGAEVEIQCLKLEKGLHFTGMPTWDYSNEFEKCWKHFRAYKGSANDVIAITISDQNGTFMLPYDIGNMAKKPKVTKNGVWTVSGDVYAEANTHSVYENSVIFISTIKETIIQVYFNSNSSYIYIDAYDY